MKALKESLIGKTNISSAYTISPVEPGSDLKDGDLILVGYYFIPLKSYKEYQFGRYNGISDEIKFFSTYCYYSELREKFYQDVPGNMYTKYIIRIYRDVTGNPEIEIENDNEKTLKEIENNKNYVCVYNNKDLSKKFKIK